MRAESTGQRSRMRHQIVSILGKSLHSIKENNLEKFIKIFCKKKPPRGKKKIQMRHLKNKPAKEIAETIVECYTLQYGPSRVIEVLKKMSLNQTRIDLQEDLKRVKKRKPKKGIVTKVQTEGNTSVKQEQNHPILGQGDKTQSNHEVSQKESLTVDGIPTSPQTQEKGNVGVPRTCAAQDDARYRLLRSLENQEELNNGAPRRETIKNVEAQMTKADTNQEDNPSDNLISLSGHTEAKGDVARLEEGQEGTTTFLISNIKQEKQESFLTHRESKVGNISAIQNAANRDLQEQNHNGGDPKEDILVDKVAEEDDPNVRATGVQTHKRSATNKPKGTKKNNSQIKRPTAKCRRTRQIAKDGGKHFVEKHRVDLIERMTTIDPVLDELLVKKILTQEQYGIVRVKKTDQLKMRELYCYERSWGTPEKNTFLRLLKKHNPPLIKDLNRKMKKKR